MVPPVIPVYRASHRSAPKVRHSKTIDLKKPMSVFLVASRSITGTFRASRCSEPSRSTFAPPPAPSAPMTHMSYANLQFGFLCEAGVRGNLLGRRIGGIEAWLARAIQGPLADVLSETEPCIQPSRILKHCL